VISVDAMETLVDLQLVAVRVAGAIANPDVDAAA